ncbi:MAG: TIGR01212 family radical SAM protein [Candidatus Glassbacteria bacterium]|nr:TIGR01212 family radical SAM protein [Candidatus Glassbacteria bacterium]
MENKPDIFPGPDGKRYRSFSSYLKSKFSCRVHKISVDAGFSCPNRDGTIGTTGCIFCCNEGFSFNTRSGGVAPVKEQLKSGIEHIRQRFRAEKFIAYFQAFTNTYAPVDRLRTIYDNIRKFPEIVGLFIGTRPDCVPDPVLDLIASYRRDYLTWVEYGLQSSCAETLELINRGHGTAEFTDAVERAHARGIEVCAHVILGLPGEDSDRMLATAGFLGRLGVDGVKLHALHVLKKSPLEAEYAARPFPLLELGEYASLACDFLERIPAEMVLLRLAAEAPRAQLVGPRWCASKNEAQAAVEAELERRDSFQGRLFRDPA